MVTQKFKGKKEKFFVGTGEFKETPQGRAETTKSVSREDFKADKKAGIEAGIAAGVKAQQKPDAKQRIAQDPEAFGLQTPGKEVAQPSSIEVQTTPAEQPIDRTSPGQIVRDIITGEGIREAATEQGGELRTGTPPILAPASAVPYLVAGRVVAGQKAVQAGNAVKNARILSKINKNPATSLVAAYAGFQTFQGVTNFLGRTERVDGQQQALNTIGQMATTIGGQATEASGDWRKGMQELDYLYDQILELEILTQQGKIASAQIKFDGQIYALSADIEDQLRTIDEQRTIIRSFVLTNSFPELSDLEIQNYLRDLEEGGHVKPIDITEQRRDVAQTDTSIF